MAEKQVNLNEKLDAKILHLFKVGLVDRSELSKYKIAFKDKEQNVKYQQYRTHILDIFDKILNLIKDNDAVYQKIKQDIQKKYGNQKLDYKTKESNKVVESLELKAKRNNIGVDALIEVYNRGISLFEEEGEFNKTPEQFAFDRVNSFCAEGEAYNLDKDLIEEATRTRGRPRTKKTKRYNVKSANNRSLAKVAAGSGPYAKEAARELATRKKASARMPKRQAARKIAGNMQNTSSSRTLHKLVHSAPRGAVKTELKKVLDRKSEIEAKDKETVKSSKETYQKMKKAMGSEKAQTAVKSYIKTKAKAKKAVKTESKPAANPEVAKKSVISRIGSKMGRSLDRFLTGLLDLDDKKHKLRQIKKDASYSGKVKRANARATATGISAKGDAKRTVADAIHREIKKDLAAEIISATTKDANTEQIETMKSAISNIDDIIGQFARGDAYGPKSRREAAEMIDWVKEQAFVANFGDKTKKKLIKKLQKLASR